MASSTAPTAPAAPSSAPLTLTSSLDASPSTSPSSPAIIVPARASTPAQTITYAGLRAAISAFQTRLAAIGITHGSRVSIALPNNLELVVAFFATASQRAIAAPLNPAYRRTEFEFYIADVRSSLVLVPQGAVQADAPAVQAARNLKAAVAEVWWDAKSSRLVVDVKEWGSLNQSSQDDSKLSVGVLTAQPDDVALVLHTSGTTSRPKVVPLTHKNLTSTMKNIQATYELTPQDRTMLVMPLFHVHGLLCGLLAPLHSGGSIVLPLRFSASDFWRDFTTHGANWYTAVPTIHQILLRSPLPSPVPKIRFIRSCSSPLSPTVFHQLEATLHAPVLEAYAMTEAAHQMTSNPLPAHGARKPGSVGTGQGGVQICVVDEAGKEVERGGGVGEICVRGDNVTTGYLNNEAANATAFTPDGQFFRTGDQGRLDADGYVFITGRIKELINKGGEKISPIEIDNLLTRHPEVAEAVCFAIDDELYGQDIGAAVVLKEKEGQLSEEQLKAWVGEHAAKFKIPKKIYFTKTMPKTATGKIQRRIVAETMLKQHAKPKAKL